MNRDPDLPAPAGSFEYRGEGAGEGGDSRECNGRRYVSDFGSAPAFSKIMSDRQVHSLSCS